MNALENILNLNIAFPSCQKIFFRNLWQSKDEELLFKFCANPGLFLSNFILSKQHKKMKTLAIRCKTEQPKWKACNVQQISLIAS